MKVIPIPVFESSTSAKPSTRPVFTHFFYTYTNILYYIFCSPFRFHLEHRQGILVFTTRSWLPHKIICALIVVSHIPWAIAEVMVTVPKTTSENPSRFLLLLERVFSLSRKLMIIKLSWRKQGKLLEILNFICENEQKGIFEPRRVKGLGRLIIKRRVVTAFFSVYTTFCLGFLVGTTVLYRFFPNLSKVFIPPHQNVTSSSWLQGMQTASSNLFFVDFYEYSSLLGHIFTGIAIVGFISRCLLYGIHEIFEVSSTLTLWSTVEGFSHPLQKAYESCSIEETKLSSEGRSASVWNLWVSPLQRYESLKKLSFKLNWWMGGIVTLNVLHIILYYPVSFASSGGAPPSTSFAVGLKWVILLFSFFFTTCAFLYFASDICRKMDAMKDWLASEDAKAMVAASSSNINVILDEINSHVVSINGNEIFPITYGVVATIMGLVTTYYVVCVQTVQ